MAGITESYQRSLIEMIEQIFNENAGLAVGLMGVALGYEDGGGERFEVRLSKEIDGKLAELLPITYQGFSINYEKVGVSGLE